MEIREVPIKKLNPAKYNPRKDLKPDDPEYIQLEKSIKEFGNVDPIIWNEDTGNIVGGHQRFKVLSHGLNGNSMLPVSVVNLSEQKEKALNVALNKISGEWDFPKYKDLIAELNIEEFDLDSIGLNQNEYDQLFSWGTYGDPEEEWTGMPEYKQDVIDVYKTIKVHFKSEEDYFNFAKKIEQNLSESTKFIYYPKQQIEKHAKDKFLNIDETEISNIHTN